MLNLDEDISGVSFEIFGGVDDLNFGFYHKLKGAICHACKTTLKHKVPQGYGRE
jgi:hypothetical protein